MKDRIVDSRKYFTQIVDAIYQYKTVNDGLIVKYREHAQWQAFPCACETIIGGKKSILDLCDNNTLVIGPPGSALLECLLNDVPFYTYWNYELYKGNQFLNQKSIDSMMRIFYIAKNTEELTFNINNSKIYKNDHSKKDLIYYDGLRLNEIVKIILEED
jgi:hypothetical protein